MPSLDYIHTNNRRRIMKLFHATFNWSSSYIFSRLPSNIASPGIFSEAFIALRCGRGGNSGEYTESTESAKTTAKTMRTQRHLQTKLMNAPFWSTGSSHAPLNGRVWLKRKLRPLYGMGTCWETPELVVLQWLKQVARQQWIAATL